MCAAVNFLIVEMFPSKFFTVADLSAERSLIYSFVNVIGFDLTVISHHKHEVG